MNDIEKLITIIKKSNYIVFFTGAGASTDSGLDDFRGKTGLYNKSKFMGYEVEEILSHDFFFSHREIFNKYLTEKLSINNIKPNTGHLGIAQLEKIGKVKAVITQNIDNLHQDAGSRNILELHGTLKKWYCLKCGKKSTEDFICKCGGIVKPNVTLYGEALNEVVVNNAIHEIKKADTLIIVGTSLTVYPAAYYIEYFKGKNFIILNETPTPKDQVATLVIRERFAQVMDKVVLALKL